MKETIFQILQRSPFFNGLSVGEIEEAMSSTHYKIVEYSAKEIYTLAGMPCKYADFILEGEMISRMTGLSGKLVQIDRLKACILIAPAFIPCQGQCHACKCRDSYTNNNPSHATI